MKDKHIQTWRRATDTEEYPHALNTEDTYLPSYGGKRMQLQMRPQLETVRQRDVAASVRPLRTRHA
jgi:hypothetical protein